VHRIVLPAIVLSLLLAGSTAHAMSCRNRLIDIGDPAVRVRWACGEPASIYSHVESYRRSVGRSLRGVGVIDSAEVTVLVEEWTYDFGPQRFMEELTFRDGELSSMRTLGYGTPNGRIPRASAAPLRFERLAVDRRRRFG
jgi:hypothetical protein